MTAQVRIEYRVENGRSHWVDAFPARTFNSTDAPAIRRARRQARDWTHEIEEVPGHIRISTRVVPVEETS